MHEWEKTTRNRQDAENIVLSLTNQEAMFEKAFNAFKELPDAYFESALFNNPIPSKNEEKVKQPDKSTQQANSQDREYGYNKRVVKQILTDAGKVMRKDSIVKRYEEISGDTDGLKAVTNALTALQSDEVVEGWKIANVKVKGYFWGLADWRDLLDGGWEKDYIPDMYKQITLADIMK